MVHLLALLGVLTISFSAVFVRLASVSPVTATFFRALYAVPFLVAIAWFQNGRTASGMRAPRERRLAFASGLILAVDLNLWHESIALVGAGLGTVIANVQVVFVAIAAWLLHGERPTRQTIGTIALVLAGVALTSGLARHDAYGASPVLGAAVGLLAGLCYAAFLLVFRAANRSLAPVSGPLLDSTIGTVAGALVCAHFDRHFTLTPHASAQVWLVLLAVVSQVIGWLLIATALPRLPAVETSVMLLVQPVITVLWGVLIFKERLSLVQWIGSTIVLAGVAMLSASSSRQSTVDSRQLLFTVDSSVDC
jgi:drug/metabolite transporter (DMT)-like permease